VGGLNKNLLRFLLNPGNFKQKLAKTIKVDCHNATHKLFLPSKLINLLMRQLFFSFLVLAIFDSCVKNSSEPVPDTILIDMPIISTNTPATQIQGQDIVSNVRIAATNGCVLFSRIDIKEIAIRQFDIRAKATFPYRKDGEIACTAIYYTVDTTARINTISKGQYILRFYNKNLLFKSDTVQVN
jgi:hypothetical protein